MDVVVDDLEHAGLELASTLLRMIGGEAPDGTPNLRAIGPVLSIANHTTAGRQS